MRVHQRDPSGAGGAEHPAEPDLVVTRASDRRWWSVDADDCDGEAGQPGAGTGGGGTDILPLLRGSLYRRGAVTTIERMAEAMAGPEDWARFSPRARSEYRRMATRAMKVLRGSLATDRFVALIDAVLAEDADE